jgi:predicted transposase/invertase (TIGR01784 family)
MDEKTLDLHHPHDSLFKAAFKHKATLIDLLNNRLESYLLEQLDLATLKLENSSFIDEKMKKNHSDLVFSLQTKKQDQNYIYLLVEHQSTPDRHMMLRLIEYNARLYRQHTHQHKTSKLPCIINLVLYTGEKDYRGAKNIVESFQDPLIYQKLLKRNVVLELNKESDEQLLKDKKAALAEFAFVYSKYKDFCKVVDKQPIILELIQDSGYAEATLLYMLAYEKHPAEQFLDKINNLPPTKKNHIMNALQRIEQRGIQLGEQRGIQLGEQRGRQEGIQLGEQRGRQEGIQLGEQRGKQKGIQLGKQSTLDQLVKKGIITKEIAEQMLKESKE